MKIFSLNNINFCKKIPINSCKVIDKKDGKHKEATVYEYDCKDLFDIYEVSKLGSNFSFKDFSVFLC